MSGLFKPIITEITHFKIKCKECSLSSLSQAAERAWIAIERASKSVDFSTYWIDEDHEYFSYLTTWKPPFEGAPEEVRRRLEYVQNGGKLYRGRVEGGPYKLGDLRKKLRERFTEKKWLRAQEEAHEAMAYLPEHTFEKTRCPTCAIFECFLLINKRIELFGDHSRAAVFVDFSNSAGDINLNNLVAHKIKAPEMSVEEYDEIINILAPAQEALSKIYHHKNGSTAKQNMFINTDSSSPFKKTKRSTEKDEARIKIISALTAHHNYKKDSCLNFEPIGVNELARKAEVSSSSVSIFFKKEFHGRDNYRRACGNNQSLISALKILNQEFSPFILYGSTPTGGNSRDEEE
ncbi:MAG: hypothetical protein ABIK28_04415 [Planctomycetota bacterium]